MKSSGRERSFFVRPHEKWLAQANDDLAFAKLGIKEGFPSQVCFLSQQVVEKSFKAFLLAKNRPYPRLHKVVELATLCKEITNKLTTFKNDLKILDEFYIPTRYPDAVPGSLPTGLPSEQDAQHALQTAQKILELIEQEI